MTSVICELKYVEGNKICSKMSGQSKASRRMHPGQTKASEHTVVQRLCIFIKRSLNEGRESVQKQYQYL